MDHGQVNYGPLVIAIQSQYLAEVLLCLFRIANAQKAKSDHIITMNLISQVQVLIEDEQVRQGYRKVINLDMIIQVLLAEIDQSVEYRFRFYTVVKFFQCEPLLKDL